MNVLLYLDRSQRRTLLGRIGRRLEDGGLLIAGFNHLLGSSARYAVYRRHGPSLLPWEFAFSLDNLRPMGIGPWYALHDDDPDAGFLADLCAALRGDRRFWPVFDRRVDDLLDREGLCRRGKDGRLHLADPLPPWDAVVARMRALWRGLAGEGVGALAVEALDRCGYRAWLNPVGDIAVVPPPNGFPAIACGPDSL
jgi:hypothetical protein